jgi:hypothetical protein
LVILSGAVLWLQRKRTVGSARWLDVIGKLSLGRTALAAPGGH